jgi:hypothetical protein
MQTQGGAPNFTTEEIQRLLEQNQMLIFAIIERQKMKQYNECAQFQERLQHNLIKLATIADYQPNLSQVQGIKQSSLPSTNAPSSSGIHPLLQQSQPKPPNQLLQQQFGVPQQQFRQ